MILTKIDFVGNNTNLANVRALYSRVKQFTRLSALFSSGGGGGHIT